VFSVESLGADYDGISTNEFGYDAVFDEIEGYGVVKIGRLNFLVGELFLHRGAKANGDGVHAFVYYALQAGKGSSTYEEDVCCIHLQKITPGGFPASLLFLVR